MRFATLEHDGRAAVGGVEPQPGRRPGRRALMRLPAARQE